MVDNDLMTDKKVALVTGCSYGGIGYHLAKALADRGYRVVATVRTPGKEGDLSSIPNVATITMDLDDTSSIQAAKERFLQLSPTLDLLINNAGTGGRQPLIDVDMKEVKKYFETNVFGLLSSCQIFGQIMVKQGHGTIVNVGSVAGIAAAPWLGVYSATKAAVRSITTNLSYELGPLGMNVVHLAPALIATPFSSKYEVPSSAMDIYDQDSLQASWQATDYMVNTGNGRGMPPADFAKQVVFQLDRPNPPAELVVGTDSWMFNLVHPFLPDRAWISMMRRNCQLNNLRRAK